MTTPIDENVLKFEKPEGPVLTLRNPPVNVTFTQHDGTVVGVFEYNEAKRKWTFEGDMEESAKKFIHFLTEVVNPPGAS
jgi:hypothetical protein